MPREIVIIGPPGTGKTTAGVTLAEGWFKGRRVGASEVAYLAFTRAAAKEAASRIMNEDLRAEVGDKLPYFRTIHSLAYRGLRQDRPDVRIMTESDMKLFAQWSGLDGTYAVGQWEDLSEVYQKLVGGGRTEWDNCLTAYTVSRISASTPDELAAARHRPARAGLEILWHLGDFEDGYRAFVEKYESYKLANGLIDFTDMLAYALTEMKPLDEVKYVILDECQDNAPILYSIAERLFQNANEIWYAGDEDQAIYKFAAADAKLFIRKVRTAYARVFLRETHRFGKEIVDLSNRIIRRVSDRVEKEIIGMAGKTHEVRITGEFQPRVSPMLLLHRHVAGCQALAASYIASGMPFRNERGKDPLGAEARVLAFKTLHDLAYGKEVAGGSVGRLVDDLMPSFMPPTSPTPSIGQKGPRLVVHGAKKKLQDGLIKGQIDLNGLIHAKILTDKGADLIRSRSYRAFKHPEDLEYYHRVVENGHSLDILDSEGKVKVPVITTIHGSKGRQSPQVVVFTEMGRKCWDDADTEHRLAYVAATRTQGQIEFCAERNVEWAEAPYNYPVKTGKRKETQHGEF
jgi:superfamily I DNA/RNA helicase